MLRTLVALLLIALLQAGCAANQRRPAPELIESGDFREVLALSGKIYIAGQPTPRGLSELRDAGVTTVVSLRTQREMDNRDAVPFDEPMVVEDLGMRYVHIPLGGSDTPYTRAAVLRFAQAIDESSGAVLLHCTVGWRASHMLAAYLVSEKGWSLEDAVDHARDINLGKPPLEGLLGRELTITYND